MEEEIVCCILREGNKLLIFLIFVMKGKSFLYIFLFKFNVFLQTL